MSRNPSSSSLTRRAVAGSPKLPPGYLDIYAAAPESMVDYQPVSAGSPAGSPGTARSATPGGSLGRRRSGRRFSIGSSTSDNSSTTTSLQRTASSGPRDAQSADAASPPPRQPSRRASLKSNGNKGSPVGSPADWNKTTVFSGPEVSTSAGASLGRTASSTSAGGSLRRTASVTSGASLGRTASVTSNGSRGRAPENEVPFSPAAVENVETSSPLAAFGVSSGSGSPTVEPTAAFGLPQVAEPQVDDRLEIIFNFVKSAISASNIELLKGAQVIATANQPLETAIQKLTSNIKRNDKNVVKALMTLKTHLGPKSKQQLDAFIKLNAPCDGKPEKMCKTSPKCLWNELNCINRPAAPLEAAGVPGTLRLR